MMSATATAIGHRTRSLHRDGDWLNARLLPTSDLHVAQFLNLRPDQQGKVGHCLEPLVRLVAERLGGDLSFVVLMASLRPGQTDPAARTAALDFVAINNASVSAVEQEHFRRLFRFVSHPDFDRFAVQTSRILLQDPTHRHSAVVYQLRGEETAPDHTGVAIGPLIAKVADSNSFRVLQQRIKSAKTPVDLTPLLRVHFEQFVQSGALEREVLSADVLRCFEDLIERFHLRRSSDVRRRLLNYFVWMLLCDARLSTYSYLCDPAGPPSLEFICATRSPLQEENRTEFNARAREAFKEILEAAKPVRGAHATRPPAATMADERHAIDQANRLRTSQAPDPRVAARQATAVAELDRALTNYLARAIQLAFSARLHSVSLEPFWPNTSDTRVPAVDVTLRALEDEFHAAFGLGAVNPFLLSSYPVFKYMSEEMSVLRDEALRLPAAVSSIRARKFGEEPVHGSGLLSLNMVFWDVHERRFRYCSVRFVDENDVYRNHFEVLFRLLETTPEDPSGIRSALLLLSDVIFRESAGELAPIRLSFVEDSDTSPLSPGHRHNFLNVWEFIEFLEHGDGHESFKQLYQTLVLDDPLTEGNKEAKQKLFASFCRPDDSGVSHFMARQPAFVHTVGCFLEHHGVRQPHAEGTIARFLGYLTWLWLCYRNRLAYYYYIPARLPLNERVGGFAIASELPIPEDVLEFLFLSIAPRIVLYPALLYHRESAGHFSRTALDCWFGGLPHVLGNTFGVKEVRRYLELVKTSLESSVNQHSAIEHSEAAVLLGNVMHSYELLREFDQVIHHLSDMTNAGTLQKVTIDLRSLLKYCKHLSSRFANDRGVAVSFSPVAPGHEGLHLPTPMILILWHVILNACAAAGECRGSTRVIVEVSDPPAGLPGLHITVTNTAPAAKAEDLKRQEWRGLNKDRERLQWLWLHEPRVHPSEVLVASTESTEHSSIHRAKVTLHVPTSIPADSQENPRAVGG